MTNDSETRQTVIDAMTQATLLTTLGASIWELFAELPEDSLTYEDILRVFAAVIYRALGQDVRAEQVIDKFRQVYTRHETIAEALRLIRDKKDGQGTVTQAANDL